MSAQMDHYEYRRNSAYAKVKNASVHVWSLSEHAKVEGGQPIKRTSARVTRRTDGSDGRVGVRAQRAGIGEDYERAKNPERGRRPIERTSGRVTRRTD